MFFNPHPENFFRCAWIDVVDKPDPTGEAMTISSLPGPERSITDADLAACRMIGLHYRNRRIGDFLKELDLVEGRNTGIPVVVNVMRENGSPPPVFSSPKIEIGSLSRCQSTPISVKWRIPFHRELH